MRGAVLVCFFVAVAGAVKSAPTVTTPVELLELRLELYRQGIELADLKLSLLERELNAASEEERRGQEEERTLLDELTSPDSETGEVGSRKPDISSTELPRAKELQETAGRRVEELRGKLAKEQARRSFLANQAEEASRLLSEKGVTEEKR